MQTINRVELESLAGPNYVTKNGKEITADAHFVCIGKRVGSSWLRDTELSDLVDAEGRLKVDSNLRQEWKESPICVPLETFATPRYVAVSLTSFSGHKTTFSVCLIHSILIKLT